MAVTECTYAEKNLGAPERCTDDGLYQGNPIHAGTGNKYQAEADYQGNGAFPLKLVRHYNSQANRPGRAGYNWNLFPSLTIISGTAVQATRADMKGLQFSFLNSQWQPDADVDEQLARLTDAGGTTTGWELTLADGVVETYTASGTITGYRHPSGQVITVSGADSTHAVLTDANGRSLTLDFDAQNNLASLTDPAGGVTTYAYDAAGNLASVTYPGGTSKTYHYEDPNFPHALTGITDENVNRYATWSYDAQGRAISSEHAGGAERVDLTFNPDGSTTVTDGLGTARTYGMTTVLGVVKSTGQSQPSGAGCGPASTAINYDANGNVASRSDFNGNTTTYTYDLSRNLETSRTEASGTAQARTIATEWHASFRLPTKVTEPGLETTFTYDAKGNVTAKTLRDTSTNAIRIWTWTYTYSGSVPGALLQKVEDGPRTGVSDITTWNYYAPDATCDGGHLGCRGQLMQVTDALGHTTQVTRYNAHGQAERIVDANGLATILSYDARQRLLSRTVGVEVTAYEYDPAGNLTRLVFPDGSYLAFTYDAAHRLTEVADTLGNRVAYTLDTLGNRTQEDVYDPGSTLARTRGREVDALNRLNYTLGALNQTTAYQYDAQGNLTGVTDPLNHGTANAYDALDRLIQVTDPANGQTQLAYDALDRLAQVTDPKGLATTYTRDGLDNLLQETSPDRGVTTYTHDSAGNRLTRTDARGVVASFAYDALNRLTGIGYATVAGVVGTPATQFTYDQGANGLGRLTAMGDAAGTTTWSHDAQGRVVGKSQSDGILTLNLGYSYNGVGQLEEITYPSGRHVTYVHTQGRVAEVRVDGVTLLSGIQYAPMGPAQTWTWGNASAYSRGFDTDGRVAGYPLGGVARDLQYDAASRITAYSHPGQSPLDQGFGYDSLDRLLTDTGPQGSLAYQYDANGNRTQLEVNGLGYPYTYDPNSNRLLSEAGPTARSHAQDGAGNTTTLGNLTLIHDAAGRLVEARQGMTTLGQYVFNGLGQRVKKLGEATFLYDEAGHLLGEYDNTGQAIQETVWLGDMPVTVIKGGAVHYVYADHLDAPRVITDTQNQIVWRWNHSDAFGSTLPNENPSGLGAFAYNLRFPGQYFDQETGLLYNWNRFYDPRSGRYIQPDPLGLNYHLNLYSYANFNPLNYSDPTGEAATLAWCFGGPVACAAGATAAVGSLIWAQAHMSSAKNGSWASSNSSADQCDNDQEDRCLKQRKREEKLCVAIAGPRYPGNPAQAIEICRKAAFQRYTKCLRGVPEADWPPLTGVDTPI